MVMKMLNAFEPVQGSFLSEIDDDRRNNHLNHELYRRLDANEVVNESCQKEKRTSQQNQTSTSGKFRVKNEKEAAKAR